MVGRGKPSCGIQDRLLPIESNSGSFSMEPTVYGAECRLCCGVSDKPDKACGSAGSLSVLDSERQEHGGPCNLGDGNS
jgi:hypothetical protein